MTRSASAMAAALVALASCGGPSAKSRSGADTGAAAVYATSEPALARTPVVEFLPQETIVAVAVGSPGELADKLGWGVLLTKHAPLVEASAELKEELGYNLMDPSAWAQIGVDITQPVGFAVLGPYGDTVIAFAAASDEARLKLFIESLASKAGDKVVTEPAGATATLLTLERERDVAFVFRGGTFMIVGGDDARRVARDVAERKRERSLAELPRYQATMNKVAFGTDVAGYVDLHHAMQAVLGYQASRMLEGAAFGADLAGQSLRFKAYVGTPSDTMLGGLLVNGTEVPAIVRATATRPWMLMALKVDTERYMRLVEQLLSAQELSEGKQLFQQFFKIDFDQELWAQLTGEVGFAITGADADLSVEVPEPSTLFGVNFTLGVNDGAAFAGVLERIVSNPMVATVIRSGADGRMTFDVPGWKPVHMGMVGNTFAASTEVEFFARLATGGGEASFVGKATNADLSALLGEKSTAGLFLGEAALGSWLMFSSARDMQMGASSIGSEEVPFSEEYQAKKAEVDAAMQEISSVEERQQQVQHTLVGLMLKWGTTGYQARAEPEGVVLYGGQYLQEGTFSELLDAGFELFGQSERLNTEEQNLATRRWELESELQEIRVRDIQRHHDAQPK